MSSKEDCVHMLWLIPQYFTMVTAEVMFYVTAIDFAYTQVFNYRHSSISAVSISAVFNLTRFIILSYFPPI